MKRITACIFCAGLVCVIISCQPAESGGSEINSDAEESSFYTPDSIEIIGDLYTLDKSGPTILLFHQGGSNARAEYGPIIPRLTEAGFNILAIDQRVGGQYYGSYNRTLVNIRDHIYGDGYSYCDAYNNLEAALDFVIARGFKGPRIVWGSSYSAALVVQLGAKRPDDIAGILSFSPASGGPMEPCVIEPYLPQLNVPLLILKPPTEMNERGQAQLALADSLGHQIYAAENGIHGSSMLVEERVGADVSQNWTVVMEFLDQVKNPG